MTRRSLFILILIITLVIIGAFVFLLMRNRSTSPSSGITPQMTKEFKDLRQQEVAKQEDLRDRDGDGLPDVVEKKLGTDETKADTDQDGLTDGEEVGFLKTDPLKPDTVSAVVAIVNAAPADSPDKQFFMAKHASWFGKSIPSPPPSVPSRPQTATTTAPVMNLNADTDQDGLTDGDETNKYGTNPVKKDTDADGYPDGVEVQKGYNPLGSGICPKSECLK